MKKYVTEFIGTFFLVLTIGLTAVEGTEFAPLAIGCALMVMVYMGGHVSGAHYNPAVTVAWYLRGKFPTAEIVPYMLAQIIGALSAAAMVCVVTGSSFAPTPAADASIVAILLVEILFTFALAIVILNVAPSEAVPGNSFYGLAIGFTVAMGAFAGGSISGGAYNPAVGIGPTVVNVATGAGSFSDLWFYFVGPLTGGALAAAVVRLQHAED